MAGPLSPGSEEAAGLPGSADVEAILDQVT